MKKTKVILVAIILVAVAVSATYAISNWYWSRNLTHSITIEGTVTAASNFGYADLADSPNYLTLAGRCVDNLLPFGEDYYARLLASDSNLEACYLKINVTGLGGCVVTADVCAGDYQDGGFNSGEVLASDMACDGSGQVKVLRNGDDRWFYKSDYSLGIYHMLYIRFSFDTSGMSPGTYVFGLKIELGDTAELLLFL